MAFDSHLYTLTEPSIKIEKLELPNMGERESGDNVSGFQGGTVPYVKINGYVFQTDGVDSMSLNLTGKYPELFMKLIDSQDAFTVDQFPRDGDVLSLRIEIDKAGTYKDIRMDFHILEFRGVPTTSYDKASGKSLYNVRAIAKLPGLYTDEIKAYPNATSKDHLISIAKELKLGLSTNISGTDDAMTRICASQTKLELLDNIVKHSYISDDSFQTYSIDPYYYINFVNLQTIFNAPNDVENYEMISTTMWDERGEDPKEGAGKKEVQLILTNNSKATGTSNFITSYNLVNNSTKIALENGYKRSMQYYDPYDAELNLVKFDVESLVSDNISDKEEPLKGRRNSDTDEYASHVKQKYTGLQSDTVHKNYNFAYINNVQNLVELDKMILVVELEKINPALYRYMKVPVDIYNYSQMSTAVGDERNAEAKKADFNLKQDEIKSSENANERENGVGGVTSTYDEFLSAHYVIIGIEYKFKADVGYSQVLKLARREWPARMNNI